MTKRKSDLDTLPKERRRIFRAVLRCEKDLQRAYWHCRKLEALLKRLPPSVVSEDIELQRVKRALQFWECTNSGNA